MRITGLILACLGILLGCSSLDRIVQKPAVEVASVDFRDPSLTAATLIVGLRVDNPNGFAIPVANLSYDLNLNGVDFATGTVSDPGRLPAKGVKVVEIPVRVSYLSLYRAVKAGTESGKVSYRVKGSVGTKMGSHPFASEGTLDLPQGMGSPIVR